MSDNDDVRWALEQREAWASGDPAECENETPQSVAECLKPLADEIERLRFALAACEEAAGIEDEVKYLARRALEGK